jgi:hypothetical protein
MTITKLSQLKLSLANTTLQVEILDLTGEEATAKTGQRYLMCYCKYRHLNGNGAELTYQAAHFTKAGKLMMNCLEINGRYQITTEISDRGYDEWVSAEELPAYFASTNQDNRIQVVDPLDSITEANAYTDSPASQDPKEFFAQLRSRKAAV